MSEPSPSAQEHLPEEEEVAGDPSQAAATQDSDAHLAQHLSHPPLGA